MTMAVLNAVPLAHPKIQLMADAAPAIRNGFCDALRSTSNIHISGNESCSKVRKRVKESEAEKISTVRCKERPRATKAMMDQSHLEHCIESTRKSLGTDGKPIVS